MIELRDEEMAHMVSLGGWLRGFEVGCIVTADNYTPQRAAGLERLDVMDYYLDRLSTLNPRLKNTELCTAITSRLQTIRAIAAWARTQLVQRRLEETWVLSLNTRNVLLRFDRVSTGGVDHCVIDAREALAPAVACRASGLVLLHTHPGGDPEPSAQDVAMTRKLKLAAQQLNITLLDHVVLADTGYLSMLEKGLLDSARGSAVLRRPVLADEDD
jgi:DNA repair protein RadC